MSVGDEGSAEALQSPFEDLQRDKAFRDRFPDSISASEQLRR
jgi:hypothetical protein